MAKANTIGIEDLERQLDILSRDAVKRIVMAGAEALVLKTQQDIEAYHHVATGNMRQNVRPGKYREDLGGGEVAVYPQGTDSRGIDNAQKAFITNYGRGGRKTAKTGDKFLTGKSMKTTDEVVVKAMEEEYDRIIQETNGG